METKQALNSKFILASTVDYNADKPAFTPLVKTPYGGVNVLALSKGQKLDTHVAPGAVTIYVLEGTVRFVIENDVVELSAGDAVLMEAGTPHNVTAVDNVKIMLVKIDN